jgi:hypothetical protein
MIGTTPAGPTRGALTPDPLTSASTDPRGGK